MIDSILGPDMRPVFWSAVLLLLGGIWAFSVAFLRRLELAWESQQKNRWKNRWQPVFDRMISENHNQAPGADSDEEAILQPAGRPESRDEREFLLLEWSQYMNRLDRVHHDSLNQFAKVLNLGEIALEMAEDRTNIIRRLKGLGALGLLDHPHAWPKARQAVDSDHPYLSIYAAQTLVEVNPHRGVPILIEQYIYRDDFPFTEVLVLLKEQSVDVVTMPILDAFWEASGDRKIRAARLFEAGNPPTLRPLIHQWLDDPDAPPELLARFIHVLGAFGHPEDETRVIQMTRHDAAPVRIQATQALAKLGTSRSAIPLMEALQDSVWWVRYRAAQALCSIPEIERDWLLDLRSKLEDPYARDILERVLVEENML